MLSAMTGRCITGGCSRQATEHALSMVMCSTSRSCRAVAPASPGAALYKCLRTREIEGKCSPAVLAGGAGAAGQDSGRQRACGHGVLPPHRGLPRRDHQPRAPHRQRRRHPGTAGGAADPPQNATCMRSCSVWPPISSRPMPHAFYKMCQSFVLQQPVCRPWLRLRAACDAYPLMLPTPHQAQSHTFECVGLVTAASRLSCRCRGTSGRPACPGAAATGGDNSHSGCRCRGTSGLPACTGGAPTSGARRSAPWPARRVFGSCARRLLPGACLRMVRLCSCPWVPANGGNRCAQRATGLLVAAC